ncbi:ethanolamine ammonia-lyase reactivating factor EutA [Paenibacillus beijingensis]|uniref:Ethanolamine utilization protein n=1 Tax=Paenibacillus beijingensis TaxID=1126833 RepID=A0A0D5NJD3_9BACL|nr:ethanolamine ammonia-lyase reactivating factor EutA [Paenibacillus beijingensis]AJY75200.1 hypothetical protein VN24_12210 [Paenibacillus beijingensis]
MQEQWITSVGIDLGTSTTKWVLSRLKLSLISGGFSLPRYEITQREIQYMSPIYTTPLSGPTGIDVEALSRLLAEEYERAGLVPADVQSGAVIITGETATKKNAEQLVHLVASHAGPFVVATAGADLESLLAGKGSGAQAHSLRKRGIIANVDIGGGTANAAYFLDGDLIATVTLHIGGRLVRLSESGTVEYVAEPLSRWLERMREAGICGAEPAQSAQSEAGRADTAPNVQGEASQTAAAPNAAGRPEAARSAHGHSGLAAAAPPKTVPPPGGPDPAFAALEPGECAGYAQLQELCRAMADALISIVMGERGGDPAVAPLLVSGTAKGLPVPDEIWISGGVGGMMRASPPLSVTETARYGDIGPLLAAALTELSAQSGVPIVPAEQAERATVIGAGTQTTEVSGATLYCEDGALPIRNAPAAVCRLPDEAEGESADEKLLRAEIGRAMSAALAIYGTAPSDPPFALAIRADGYCSYRRTQRLASVIADSYRSAAPEAGLLLVVCERDMGKSLGHALRKKAADRWRIVCIDQLLPASGDYLDVGEPLKEDIVPVVIKTLVFTKPTIEGEPK